MALLDMQGMKPETGSGGQDGEWFQSAVSLLLCDSAFSAFFCL